MPESARGDYRTGEVCTQRTQLHARDHSALAHARGVRAPQCPALGGKWLTARSGPDYMRSTRTVIVLDAVKWIPANSEAGPPFAWGVTMHSHGNHAGGLAIHFLRNKTNLQ